MAGTPVPGEGGKPIGRMYTRDNGKLELRDMGSDVVGFYDPKTDETRDHLNHRVDSGNHLIEMLKKRLQNK